MAQKVKRKGRGNGEENIRLRKDGRWEARVAIGHLMMVV